MTPSPFFSPQPVNLYTTAIASPAERKSGLQAIMAAPLCEAERSLVADGLTERRDARTEKDIAVKALENAKTAAAKADYTDRLPLIVEAQAAAMSGQHRRAP